MQGEQYSNNIIFDQYPLRYFKEVIKITTKTQYRATSYEKLQCNISFLIQIFLEFILLLLQTVRKGQNLFIAIYPGVLNKQRIHFYINTPKGQNGFTNINQIDFQLEIKKYIQTISTMKIINLNQTTDQQQLSELISIIKLNLQQGKKYDLQQSKQHICKRIISYLKRLCLNKIIRKYSIFAQIQHCFISTKIIRGQQFFCERFHQFLERPLQQIKQDQNTSVPYNERLDLLGQFLNLLEQGNALVDFEAQQHKQMRKIQMQNNLIVEIEFVNVSFFVLLSDLEEEQQKVHQNNSFLEKIEVLINYDSQNVHNIRITTKSDWILEKYEFPEICKCWLQIRKDWLLILNNQGFSNSWIDISKTDLFLEEKGNLCLKQSVKYISANGILNITCSVDRLILITLILFHIMQIIVKKNKEQPKLQIWLQSNAIHTRLLVKKWVKYLCKELSQLGKLDHF